MEPFGMHAVFFDIIATNRKESAETDVEGKVFDLDAFGLKFFDKFFGHIKTSGRGGGGAEFFSPDSLIAFYIVFLIIALIRLKRETTEGELYPIYMAAYGLFRFFIEFLRESDNIASHIWAIISFIIGISIFVEIRNKKQRNGKNA